MDCRILLKKSTPIHTNDLRTFLRRSEGVASLLHCYFVKKGIFVELYKKQRDELWTQWHSTVTNSDGRIQFPFMSESMGAGTYKLKFNVEEYYSRNNKETLYPFVEISFKTKEGEHYHIPLLLTPYGYSTYRGS